MTCLDQREEQEAAAHFDDCLEFVADDAPEDLRPLGPGVMQIFDSTRGSLLDAALNSDCAQTVHERVVFSLLGLAFERKQVPRFIENVSS
jgi:hypothetical protein